MTTTSEGPMVFSPNRNGDTDKENELPVLSLIQFSRAPFLSFGVVKVGTSRSVELLVENPTDEGEAEVWVERIPSVRGFCVDRDSFTIQPRSSTTLTVTWTPTDEGGVRELIVFNANGVLKHQAVLLGRAEAPKKKKKRSLWDKIKSQKAGENLGSPRRRWEQPLLKMAASRNNQLTRNPRSKRDKVRSPLSSLNESKATREGSGHCRYELQQPESFKFLKSSAQVLLGPPSETSGPENKVPTKLLNRTMSPVGTPDHIKKLMPRIDTQSPLPTALDLAGLPSLSGALALINSDLGVHSPPAPGPLGTLPEPNPPRLTFFVSKTVLSSHQDPDPPKKLKFSTDTVVKGKAPTPDGHSGRVVKKSRRRILQNQPEHCPVIDMDTRIRLEVPESTGPSLDVSVTDGSLSSAPVVPFTPASYSSPLQLWPPSSLEKPVPVHLPVKSKKRKSEGSVRSTQTSGIMKEGGECLKRSKVTQSKSSREVPLRRPPQKSRPSGSASIRSSRSTSLKTARVPAVAKTTLVFCRPAQTVVPRHPLPFAAQNMFYDERWMEKQERGFTWWLNYVLTPEDFRVTAEVTTVSAACVSIGASEKISVVRAPTKEEVSFSTYTAHRRLNRLRRTACRLFTSDAMVKAIQKLELEVEAGRLLVRRDRPLWRDIGKRQQVLTWILSYNPLWLRIGLETIFGELVPLTSNSDTVGLATFVLQRFLWNPDIAAQFRHPTVPHLYRDGHEEALSRFTLKKLLLLVCFLDLAKQSRLMEHDPCLFCKDAQFKSSKELLLAFSRDFLSGEGILPRHLGYLGLPVCHVQMPLDEFDFAVTNLAVDLRCGVRLARVTELLLRQWTLSSKLRLPVVSRLQKVHNVDVALQLLQRHGVQLKDEHGSVITAKDVVDGHREKTLSLLWKIILTFQVETILDENQLKEEICFLQRSFRAVKSDHTPLTWDSYQHPSTKIGLLMDWVRSVCAFYSLKVENFSVAFSDGRVLCLLIHHYHPCLILRASVSLRTTQTVDCPTRGRLILDCSSDMESSSDGPSLTHTDLQSVEFAELLENEKKNFKMVNSAVTFLGGVPTMIQPGDMSNTIPNEKVVISYLAFLCVRLLDLRNETRAARRIQEFWRSCILKRRSAAALKIQMLVRNFLQRRRDQTRARAALVIQTVWRGFVVRRRLRREREATLRHKQDAAATVIQAVYRGKRTRDSLKRATEVQQHRAAIVLQTAFRGWSVRRHEARRHCAATLIQTTFRRFAAEVKYRALRLSALILQTHYRRWRLQQRDRRRFLDVKRSAVILQAALRGLAVRREIDRRQSAATVIQSYWRGRKHRLHFLKTRDATLMLQRRLRAVRVYRQQRALFIRTKAAAITLQRHVRSWSQRRHIQDVVQRFRFSAAVFHHLQAIKIQRALRRHWALESARAQVQSVVVIQSWVRAWQQRRRFLKDRLHVILVQRAVRHWLTCRHRAATVIQRAARRFLLRLRQQRVQRGIVQVQALWRGHCSRRVHDNPRVVALRHKLHQISVDVRDQDKLGHKTSSALDLLLHYKHFSGILEALKNLETATRLSPVCCERLVEGGATAVIFRLIRCCNRSVPCMDVIVACVQILLHLSKYHRTVEAVASVDGWLETLLELLQKYRERSGDKVAEKAGSIFTRVCLLLVVLLQEPGRAQEVMSQARVVERVRSIYRLTTRKHHMDTRRNVAKNKMSTSSSFLLPATPRPRPLPRFSPDWVLSRKTVRDEVDPLRAMQMLADALFVSL